MEKCDPARDRNSSPLRPRSALRHLAIAFLGLVFFFTSTVYVYGPTVWESHLQIHQLPPYAADTLAHCRSLSQTPPTTAFSKRTVSDRFVPGTRPHFLKNARVWTGNRNGTEIVIADILLDNGLIKGVGRISPAFLAAYADELVVIDLKGAWVTPGIVDLHSHIGDSSSPELKGASSDDNSRKGPILPWLRALDGLNTHDDSFELSISGGVTTALVLPGSANAIGGQGFTIKLRPTDEKSPTSMLLEPPYNINVSFPDDGILRWRQMKHACGEYKGLSDYCSVGDIFQIEAKIQVSSFVFITWLFQIDGDTIQAPFFVTSNRYNHARELKVRQDEYCQQVLAGNTQVLSKEPFPQDLQWESLVDVLRGRVKVHIHCYEAVDLDDVVRLTNEFQFPVAAFHHAHEAYLVPTVLKKAFGRSPAVAMFATNARYKREAYRGSEFAPRLLAQSGIPVVMKSDHPVTDSRYLLYEAQQAFVYGLPDNLAIASVTSTPAEVMGMGHRIGYIKEGWDADIVVWDSHPLALGATPTQVFIDGIPQLTTPHVVSKPRSFQSKPRVPDYAEEARNAIKYEGLPPLEPRASRSETVLFTNVRSVLSKVGTKVKDLFTETSSQKTVSVLVDRGEVKCVGTDCTRLQEGSGIQVIDLEGGSISPGLVTYGSPIGLEEIESERSTNDGVAPDSLSGDVPSIVGGDGALIRAVDGLQFGGRSALLAYRAGVTTGISTPKHYGFLGGLSTSFSTGVSHRLKPGAIVQEVNALHVSIKHAGGVSVSTQVASLRRLLVHPAETYESDTGRFFREIRAGRFTLVVETDNADIIATIIHLKKEVEQMFGASMKWTISGGAEAHLLAKELAQANVGVVQIPSRPFPYGWDQRRILPGPPLSKESSLMTLIENNVTVGIGIMEAWSARNTRFDLAWIAIEAGGRLSKAEAIALASTNLDILLGGTIEDNTAGELVATSGGDLLDVASRVVAVISPQRGLVDML